MFFCHRIFQFTNVEKIFVKSFYKTNCVKIFLQKKFHFSLFRDFFFNYVKIYFFLLFLFVYYWKILYYSSKRKRFLFILKKIFEKKLEGSSDLLLLFFYWICLVFRLSEFLHHGYLNYDYFNKIFRHLLSIFFIF